MLQKVIDKCKEEIEWAKACIDEYKSGVEYAEDDKIYLPAWKKAHEDILNFINSQE